METKEKDEAKFSRSGWLVKTGRQRRKAVTREKEEMCQ